MSRERNAGMFQKGHTLTRTHGHAVHGKESPEYRTWDSMRARCLNPKHRAFFNYGGRGITICPEWDSFEQFFADMGPRPEGMTLDRRKNHEGYSKSNCRWATRKEQHQNTRVNVNLEFEGKTQCVSEWARQLNTSDACLFQRIRAGWTVERTLTTPVRKYSR